MIDALTGMVNSFGYLGIFISTSLEYGCFPVSSEVLLPFIGFFVFGGEMSLFGAILVSTAGGIAGSLVCYCFGRFGRRFIEKTLCSKYSSLKKGLEKAGRVFDKYGSKSVLIARVFPIARTYISIPAGLMGMNIYVFVIYTAVGSFVWNTMLISAGYFLGGYGSLIKGNILFYVIMVLVSIVLIKLSKEMSK
ncbi:MAG TPA: DedA family protein [Firmicutes bacterium]|mgnify:FL=1|nr:DedA family protein [Bacillota bacterium]